MIQRLLGRYEGMRIIAISLLSLLTGCSSNPWAYNSAPGSGASGSEALQKPVIYIEPFAVGSGVDMRWSDVSPEMHKAFTRAILKTGKFEIATDPASARQSFAAFLVSAEITDFMHTSEAPESVRRLSWFSEANDAIVALDLSAVDAHTNRAVFSDQLVSVISAHYLLKTSFIHCNHMF